ARVADLGDVGRVVAHEHGREGGARAAESVASAEVAVEVLRRVEGRAPELRGGLQVLGHDGEDSVEGRDGELARDLAGLAAAVRDDEERPPPADRVRRI